MYYTGVVNAKDIYQEIIAKITAVQPGSGTAWWRKESSLDSDGVFTSTGETGTERIVLILRQGTIGSNIIVGMARDYTPGAVNTTGAFDNVTVSNFNYYTGTKSGDTLVTYHLSVTKNRIILHLQGDKQLSWWQNPVVFLGMPIRYSDTDKRCILRAISETSPIASFPTLIEDSIGNINISYTWHHTAAPSNPSWGGHYFLEPLHFGKSGEGLRGELDGLYGLSGDNVVDGDVIDVNGNKYLVIKRVATGSNAFPRDTYAMKMT